MHDHGHGSARYGVPFGKFPMEEAASVEAADLPYVIRHEGVVPRQRSLAVRVSRPLVVGAAQSFCVVAAVAVVA